jgi:hypothetical protein
MTTDSTIGSYCLTCACALYMLQLSHAHFFRLLRRAPMLTLLWLCQQLMYSSSSMEGLLSYQTLLVALQLLLLKIRHMLYCRCVIVKLCYEYIALITRVSHRCCAAVACSF